MSASKSRKARTSPDYEVTAQPSSISQQIRRVSVHEKGLSVDPEDLGTQYLSDATDQSNFESIEGDEQLAIVGDSMTDDVLMGASFEQGSTVWDQTVDLSRQNPDNGELRTRMLEDLDADEPRDTDSQREKHARAVDTRHSSIEEASLLDQDSEDEEELQEPEVNTDDQDS